MTWWFLGLCFLTIQQYKHLLTWFTSIKDQAKLLCGGLLCCLTKKRSHLRYMLFLYYMKFEHSKISQKDNYTFRLTRLWYFWYGSSTYQFLLFQKEVVILSRSLLWVLLQKTCSLRRLRRAGFFFHSFFLYPAYKKTRTSQTRKHSLRLWQLKTCTLRLIQRPQCSLMNLSTTDFTVFLFAFFTL